jgi:hypothetical protein
MPVGAIYPGNSKFGYIPGQGIVVKTHRTDTNRWGRAVHLVRNPFDAIEAFYRWVNTRMMVRTWPEHLNLCLKGPSSWPYHTKAWMGARCPTYRVLYEDLHRDTAGTLAGVLGWLGVEDADIERGVAAGDFETMRAQWPQMARKGIVGGGIEAFSEQDRERVREACGPWMHWWA